MKKLMVAILMTAIFVTISQGSTQVSWAAGAGFYWDPTFDALLSPGGQTIAQLMYSPDSTKDNITTGLIGDVNDVILTTYNITEGITSSVYADFGAGLYTGTYNPGYVYALIFQDNTVQVGDWYFYTPMLTLQDITGGNPAQSLQMNTDLFNGNAINSGSTVAQVVAVPEPATFGLMTLGGIGAFLLRRNKLRAKEEADV